MLARTERIPVDAVERALQLHVMLLSILGGLLVDLNRDGQRVSYILALVALSGFVVSDYLRWFSIPRFLVGILTLGAIFPLSLGFWEADTQGQLNLITYLLTIWLSVIFFQFKTPRVYGSLIVLSLLLVVIAAILSSGIVFAILLLLYHFVGISALVLLYVHSGQLSLQVKYQAGMDQVPDLNQAANPPYALLLGRPPIAFQDPASLPQRERMWHKATMAHTAGLCLATILFGGGFFYAIPRVSQGEWTTPRSNMQQKVGFTAELTFEEMGRILESDDLAFRMTLTDARTGEPYQLVTEAYIQGLALTQYTITPDGRAAWHQYDRGAGRQLMQLDENYAAEVVRQEVLLQPTLETTLFAIPASFRGPDTPNFLRIDRQAGRIFRPNMDESVAARQQRYVLYTTGCRNNSQLPLVPVNRIGELGDILQRVSNAEMTRLLSIDERRFPKLIALAKQIAAEAPDQNNRISIARQLQDFFLSEERGFKYTLDFDEVQKLRKPDVDPIEDFVANHRTGHCEYYASALAMMLRSVGIPSRIVVGYYGGEFNRLGGYYQVYQRDAHAWVEAYLEPHQVPAGPLSEAISPGGAAWYRLDPTPREEEELAQRGIFSVDQVLDYAQLLWNDYVLDMNPQQKNNLLEPGQPADIFRVLPFARPVRDFVVRWFEVATTFLTTWVREGWWNWRGGVIAGVIAAIGYLLLAAGKWLYRFWAAHEAIVHQRVRKIVEPIEFYHRLETLFAEMGLRRAESQTQHEFAVAAGRALVQQAANHSGNGDSVKLALLPARVVEYFYRVRFGQQPLAPAEEQEIERLLSDIDQTIRAGNGDSGSTS